MRVILVDSMNLVYRNHYVGRTLTTEDGRATGALHGFLGSIHSLHKKWPKARFIFCWDALISWRHRYSKKYKAKRRHDTSDGHARWDEVKAQVKVLREVLDALGFRQFLVDGLEADDLIGLLASTLTQREDIKRVLIYSGDRDYYQLVGGRVRQIRPMPKEGIKEIRALDVVEESGISPADWVKFRALAGDSSDGLKPVPGVGPKGALKLLMAGADPTLPKFEQHPKAVRKEISKLEEHWDSIRECYILSRLPRDESFEHWPETVAKEIPDVIHVAATKRISRRKMSTKEKNRMKSKFLEVTTEYQLEWLRARRHDFFGMP